MRRQPISMRCAQGHPYWRVVASALLATREPIDAGIDQAIRGRRVQQKEVDAQPGITAPTISLVVPKCVHRLVGVTGPSGVDPPLIEQAPKARAAFRLEQCVLRPGFGWVDVPIG